MDLYVIRKLERFALLRDEDKQALRTLASRPYDVGASQDLIGEGDDPQSVRLILAGWACRYKELEDGRRQIIAILLPGDFCDTHVYVLRQMDHSIGTLTPVTFARIARPALEEVTAHHPYLMRAFWWSELVSAAIQRQWTVNLGRHSAKERLGHLCCELFLRLRAIGLTEGDSCAFPLTQANLAAALGLTNVHTNRCLQELRGAGLIILDGRRLTIPDLPALQQASLLNPNYLHLAPVSPA